MNIQLKHLSIRNFKGIKSLDIDFNHTTEISGKNESGKSTIADAYFWLLFGKNSEDIKDFNIKNTVDTNMNKFDHEVSGVFNIDATEITLTRTFREKWTTRRGESTKEFTGHETDFAIDGVPKSLKEYNDKIASILPESIAKLITNPFSFNSLKWEQRREVLVKIAGNPQDSDISNGNEAFEALLRLIGGKSLIEFKKQIAAKKKTIHETLDFIPARIDESTKSLPESQDFNFIAKSIENKTKLISNLDIAITDKVNAHREASAQIIQKQNDLNRLKMELQNLEGEAKRLHQNQISEIERKINNLENSKETFALAIKSHQSNIDSSRKRIASISEENNQLITRRDNINATSFKLSEDVMICPTCKQRLPEGEISEITSSLEINFNQNKIKTINAISITGKSNNALIENYKKEIEELQQKISTAINENIKTDTLIGEFRKQKAILLDTEIKEGPKCAELREQITNFVIPDAPVIEDAELKQHKAELQKEVDELRIKLSVKTQIENIQARILQLETQERELAQEIANLEQTEFTIEKFTRAKMDIVEHRVNSMFKMVKFQMFEVQINEGLKETCICLVNGVPFADANNAGKINAGLDIINTLSGFYNIYAPVFIDNAEAVNEVFPIASQLLRLVVTTEPLKIS